jgi:hypothetical protein
MPRPLTVFYSWQSDTPSNLNRSFIEKALHEALKRLQSDATLESALRETSVELDKDTKGVAGSPPIADTILRKIEECAVFVADLTFVGESMKGLTNSSEKPRLFPNPNVLIEHGYALKCHGHAALVGIMNTAFGKPSAESLPFDLRHRRWPITYHLADPSDPGKTDQYEKLVKTLVDAISLILSNRPPSKAVVAEFVPQKPTKSAAFFFDEARDLVVEGPFGGEMQIENVPDKGVAYLRLYPIAAVSPYETELEAEISARTGDLRPMGVVRGWSTTRNVFGAIAYEAPVDRQLYHFTQLFLSREIWGIDAFCVNAGVCRAYTNGTSNGFIPTTAVEEVFVLTLQNYLNFAKAHLKLSLPVRVEAGLVGIKGYQLGLSHGLRGKALQDTAHWNSEVVSYDTPAHEILVPFFRQVWGKCGVERLASHQTELARKLGIVG